MSAWQSGAVADAAAPIRNALVGGPFGSDLTSRDYVQFGIPVIRGTNLSTGRWVGGDFVYVTEEKANSLSANCAAPGDLVFTQRGTLGQVALAPVGGPQRYLISQSQMKLTVDPSKVAAQFIYYVFISEEMQSYIRQHAIQTGVPHINLGILRETPIPLPPLKEQHSIAATLGALDDKIESNRRARTLMRKLGSAQLQAATADDPYEAHLRDATTSIARGVAPKYADDDHNGAVVLNQRCVRDGRVDTSSARRMVPKDVAPERRAASGDVLVNSTGTGTLGRVGRWHGGDVFIDGHVTVVKANEEVVGPTVLAYAMFGRESDIEGMATGSTGQTELSPSRLAELELQLPSRVVMSSIEGILLEFEERIFSLEREESILTQLRDVLLPELLSGRIRVPEATEIVEQAVA